MSSTGGPGSVSWPSPVAAEQGEESRHDSSAARVLRLLDAFVGSPAVVGVSQLAERAHLPKSTAHRLLRTLTHEGYVRRVDDRYCLSNRVFEIGNQVISCRPSGLREQAMPFLVDLFQRTRQTVHLAVLQDDEVLYIEKIFGHNAVRTGTAVGTRRPPHATALGKAMLAFSPEDVLDRVLRRRLQQFTPRTQVDRSQIERQLAAIRSAGLATDRGEFAQRLSCVAAPVSDPRTGHAVAAVSVSTGSGPEFIRWFGPQVVQTAAMMSRSIILSLPDGR